jgi:hypothetical protein
VKIAEIPESWKQATLYPSSIPHLLHWDLAYLWILLQEPAYRPDSWAKRIEMWRRLLALFLAGRLDVDEDAIPLPMLTYTAPYGVRRLQRLVLRQGEDRITAGVISPVVIVRPLPDREMELREYPEDRARVREVLTLLIDRLDAVLKTGVPANRRLQSDLLKLLTRERDSIAATAAEPLALRPVASSVLRAIDFHRGARQSQGEVADPIDIYVVDREGPTERQYVPRCAVCRELLTRRAADPAVVVAGEHVDLPCPGGHQNSIPFEKLFIWKRTRSNERPDYVVWQDRRGDFTAPVPDPEWPPHPSPSQAGAPEIGFEWNPGALSGESQRRMLRLRFEDGTPRFERLGRQVFYESLLIPSGDAIRFQGTPVRFDWRDAWRGVQQVQCTARQVDFQGVNIAGIPFTFTRSYAVNVQYSPDLAVGVYPAPMHSQWKAYRALAAGPAAANFVVRAEGERLLPVAVDTTGWPEWIAVETHDQRTGASFDLRHLAPPAPQQAMGRVRLGIDFGTSNTVVYFRAEGDRNLNTGTHAIQPARLRDLVYWVHERPAPTFDLGWFLPPPHGQDQDSCLFPSAMWVANTGQPVLRWVTKPPGDRETSYAFKWDDPLRTRHAERVRYLREVFFLSVPALLHSMRSQAACPPLDIGFSYPLAFTYDRRRQHLRMMQDVAAELERLTGHRVQTFSINESLAAVRALGSPNPGSLYLVADLGGRTLDVALVRSPATADAASLAENVLQIGSLDFGGELFLRSVVRRHVGTEQGSRFYDAYWDLRDRIQAGTAAGTHGADPTTSEVMDRLHILAFEFLRTMAEALRQHLREPERIRLLLIGNGWRLRDLRAGGQDPKWHFRDFAARMMQKMAVPGFEPENTSVPGIEFSKHLVAVGALKAAEDLQLRELEEGEPFRTRLPLGRGIALEGERREWHEYAGEDGLLLESTELARTGPIDFDLASRPDPPAQWDALHRGLTLHYGWDPEENQLRDWVKRALVNDRLLKGPLQLIMENHWSLSL